MLSFESDYTGGAHESVLRRLIETNGEILPGYGTDAYCRSAAQKIRETCGCPEAEVYFLTGGTQTNQLILDAMLQPYEGVIAAESGHINTHEAGAIERTGHKVLTLSQREGKLDAGELEWFLKRFQEDENREHMVFPGMVYLTWPTEYGTIYSAEELAAISGICRKYGIALYLDGARLGYGLAAEGADLTLPDIARLCDVFYIGGTKVGALCGEAVVFPRGNAPSHFMTRVKQHGALLAKGRLLGVQFDALFTDQLYFTISAHAVEMARRLKRGLRERGYRFYLESPTNQQFVILENGEWERLRTQVALSFWEKADQDHTIVRFATSWATAESDLEALWRILDQKS